MKQSIYIISALVFFAFFTSCEKFELEDHCPEEEQNETFENPQELRVNDDSDSEETGSTQTTRDLSSDSESGIKSDKKKSIGSSDDSGDDTDDGEDLINDDSDNEDEGGDQSRRPGEGGSSNGAKSAK